MSASLMITAIIAVIIMSMVQTMDGLLLTVIVAVIVVISQMIWKLYQDKITDFILKKGII